MLVRGLFMLLRGFLVMVGGVFCHGLPLSNARCSMPRNQRAVCSQLLR
jgi:hypothetical protein